MSTTAVAIPPPSVLAHLRRAAVDKGILRGNAAAITSRLEEMAYDVLPENGRIFSSLFTAGTVEGVLTARGIGELFWRERMASTLTRRQEGSFYTPEAVIDCILDLVLPELSVPAAREDAPPMTVCDPAVGCGFFLLRLVERLRLRRIAPGRLRRWAGKALYGVDMDAAAVFMTKALLWLALSDGRGECIPDAGHFRKGDALLGPAFGEGVHSANVSGDVRPGTARTTEAADTEHAGLDWAGAFPSIGANGGFDIVVGNPPYEVLTNFSRYPARKALASAIRTSGHYHDSLSGQINLYRCFIERGLALLKSGGALSYVVPLSLARDGSAEAVRRRLLCCEGAGEWLLFGENEKLFQGVTQSACIFRATKGGGRVRRLGVKVSETRGSMGLGELESCGGGLVIPALDREGLKMWRWLYGHCPGRLGDVAEARVGEVDQTVFRACMLPRDTGCILARGAHLQPFFLDVESREEKERFLDLPRFLDMKGNAAEGCRERAAVWRVAQLGIRNMHSVPRLSAALVPPGVYLGNSLNVYIPKDASSLRYLAGVLNSSWLDWLFRVGSGNNNINLKEMLALPFPVPDRITARLRTAVEDAYRACEQAAKAARGGEGEDALAGARAELDAAVADCYAFPKGFSRVPPPVFL